MIRNYIAALILLFASQAWAEPTVSLQLDAKTAVVGDTVIAHLSLVDFPTTEGGGLTLRYNQKALAVTDVTFDEKWSFASKTRKINNKKGVIKDLVFAAFPGISGNTSVATIRFTAKGKGKSRFRMKPSKLNPFSSAGMVIDVSFQKENIKVKKN